MDKISVSLENCFGIKKLKHDFDFTKCKIAAIYARNGFMKTSFAKTFHKIQNADFDGIKDEIFSLKGNVDIRIDGKPIKPEDVFVIKSFEQQFESNVTTLLINDTLKDKLKNVLKIRSDLLKKLEVYSGLKITRKTGGITYYELEDSIIDDLEFEERSFLLNIEAISELCCEEDWSGVKYKDIFSVEKKIKDESFQKKIKDYIKQNENIYKRFKFLSKGNMTFSRLKNVQKSLSNENFFTQDNNISLSGQKIQSISELNTIISKIDEEIKKTKEFQDIEKLLGDVGGTKFKDILEANPSIIESLKVENLPKLKKNIWISYFKQCSSIVENLRNEYKSLINDIEKINLDDTPWRDALKIFESRFTVPYKMKVSNLKGAIIGESVPQIEFEFSNGDNTVCIDRSKLDEIDILSQGEKRALYLLNIIFEIEKIKRSGMKKLFIVDDIADSFDYKNKYAIIEYLYEISMNDNFNMIILSHNFDFYRAVSSRLSIDRKCRFFANELNDEINLKEELYQKNPVQTWLKKYDSSLECFIALIPFVRNIIELNNKCNEKIKPVTEEYIDYIKLTSLLHEKDDTHKITLRDVHLLFQKYVGLDNECKLDSDVLDKNVIEILYKLCDSINQSKNELEHKVLLSMAIRHKAEIFLLKKITDTKQEMNWKQGNNSKNGSGIDFINEYASKSNQMGRLFDGYKQLDDSEQTIIKILSEVNIMTPENIHVNSFMYEPLIDMDINHRIPVF